MVWFKSYTPPHFGRGRLQAEAVVRRRESKAVIGSPGATPASTQPGGRPPASARAPGPCSSRRPLAVVSGGCWYGAPPTPRHCFLSLRVVASCSVHPVREQHRQAVQSALVHIWVRNCDAGSGKRAEQRLPASDEVIGYIVPMHLPRGCQHEVLSGVSCSTWPGWRRRKACPSSESPRLVGSIEIQFLHEDGCVTGVRGEPGREPRDTPAVRPATGGSPVRRSQDDPSGRRAQYASFKRKPCGGGHAGPTERSAAFKASTKYRRQVKFRQISSARFRVYLHTCT
jgi:hypothetical protein